MLAKTLVLTFHGIGAPLVPPAGGEERYFVSQDIYRSTIETLSAVERERNVRICVTFDDGNLSDYELGMPALAAAGRSGIFFVLAGRIGKTGYLSGAQLREMVAAGMRIGSHGWDHVDWRKLDPAARQRELHDAPRLIEDQSGQRVNEAALPFGGFDPAVLAHLKQADYRRIYTSTGGLSYDDAWFCPRWSLTDSFDPKRDLRPRVSPREIARGTLYAPLRRLRYGI